MARIGGVIRNLDVDVLGLQEVAFLDVDGEVIDQPAELGRLTGREVRYAAVHAFALVEPDTGRTIGSATWGNALLTRTAVHDGFALGLPVGADDQVVEPHDSGLPLAGVTFADAPYGTREPRCAVGGRVRVDDRELGVISTHLTYAGTGQRTAQAAAIAAIVADLGDPIVLLGDLNAPIEALALAPLATALDDAFSAVGLAPGDPGRGSCGPLAIDHVLSSGFEVESCRVVAEAGDASDHLPVVASLR